MSIVAAHSQQQCISVPFSPASLPTFVCVLDDCHSDLVEMESQCNFDLHFLMAKVIEKFFMYLLAI
jgi:hypothetical protein